MLRVTSNALGLAALLSLAHCGARTGLREPDAATASDGSLDVAIDAEAAVPECATARDCDDTYACTDDRCVAGRCAHAPVDARCNDNVYCNGVERCVVGVGCAPGTPVACDDRVACTRDLCDEPTRTCRAAPDDALCPISHRCDLTRGCVARALANAAGGLFEIELPSGALHFLGPIRPFTDVALHPDRTLYAITASGELWRVDANNGSSVFEAATGTPFTALDASPDGALFAAGSRGLFRINPALGTADFVASFPPGLEASGDIAFLEGRLLATARTGPAAIDELVEFFPDTGRSQLIGRVGFTCVWALAAFGPTLYGMTCNGQVLAINAATGAGRQIAQGAAMFYGATAR